MYELDLALDNPQGLICHRPNQLTNQPIDYIYIQVYVSLCLSFSLNINILFIILYVWLFGFIYIVCRCTDILGGARGVTIIHVENVHGGPILKPESGCLYFT